MTALQWQTINPGGGPGQTPGNRCGHVLTNSPEESGAYLLFGGQEKNGLPRNDVSVLSESFGRWTWKQLPCKGAPPLGVRDCAAWPVVLSGGPGAAEGSFLIVHGGVNAQNVGMQNTYALNIQSCEWFSVFAPMSPPPRGLCAYGQAMNALWIFGGRAFPEGLKYGDLWYLRLDELADALGSNCECAWSLVSANQAKGPKARHSTGFTSDLGTGELYMYGGIVGPDDGRFDTISDELWRFDAYRGRWSGPLQTTGYRPSPRHGHALFRTGQSELVLWGGEGAEERQTSELYILDLQCLLWSQPRVGGLEAVPRRRHATSFFADGVAVVFGGEAPAVPSSTEKSRLSTSDAEDSFKALGAANSSALLLKQTEAVDRATSQKGAKKSVGPARLPSGVLDDAEALLMIAKKQKIVMERDLQKAYNERAELRAQLRQLREGHNDDQRDLSMAKIVAQESLTAHSHEQTIHRHLQQQKAAEHSYRNCCEEMTSRFKNTLAAAEAMLLELSQPDVQTSPEAITKCRDTHRRHIMALRDGLEAWQKKDAEEEETVQRAQQELQRLIQTRPRTTTTLRPNSHNVPGLTSLGHAVPGIDGIANMLKAGKAAGLNL